jgi:hypothetical protein
MSSVIKTAFFACTLALGLTLLGAESGSEDGASNPEHASTEQVEHDFGDPEGSVRDAS